MAEWTILVNGVDRSNQFESAGYNSSLFQGANTAFVTFDNAENDLTNIIQDNDPIDTSIDGVAQTTIYVEKRPVDPQTGILTISGRDKLGRFQSIFPKEATISAITNKKRHEIIKWLIITQGYGNGVTVVNVQDSPADSLPITEIFRGLRSLFDVISRYAIEDFNYQFKIDKFSDSGAVNGTPTISAGETTIPFDGTTSNYGINVFKGGKLTFTSGTLDGQSFKVTENTSTTFKVFGDATSASDDDTFDLSSNDLSYGPRRTKTYTAASFRMGVDPLENETIPANAQDIFNKVSVRGKQTVKFTVDTVTATTITVHDTLVSDEWIGAGISYTVATEGGTVEYTWMVTDNDTNTFTVDGITSPTSVFSGNELITMVISHVAEDKVSQQLYADDNGEPYINEQDIFDPTLDTQAKAVAYASNFLAQYAYVIENYSFTREPLPDIEIGDLVLTRVPEDGSRINDEYTIVSDINHDYDNDTTTVQTTYFSPELQHKLAEIIDRIRKRDNELLLTTDILNKTLGWGIVGIGLKCKAEIYTRTISDTAFVINRDKVGRTEAVEADNAKIGDQPGSSNWIPGPVW